MCLKFGIVHVSGMSFLNKSLEYVDLGFASIVKFLEPSLRFLLMYA